MMRGAIIILLLNYCTFLFSQSLSFSREFESRKKNVPLEILNNHSSYFYMVRVNHAVHDITIERRAKPGGEMLAFTPLKMDSVNASWFDYENLDYLTFEKDNKLYFLFEKVLNTKRTLYLKEIDTIGKSSGFIELASLESDNNTSEFYFTCQVTENSNILIIASRLTLSGIVRKVAMLFSIQKRKMIWTRKLPLENDLNVFTWNFSCNKTDDLLYFQAYESVISTKTYQGVTAPLLQFDSLLLWQWNAGASAPFPRWLDLGYFHSVRTAFVIRDSSNFFISVQGLEKDTLLKEEYKELIVNIKLDPVTGAEIYNTRTYYDSTITEQLTFYDSEDKPYSIYKQHSLMYNHRYGRHLYTLSERLEWDAFSKQDYFKEILLRKTNLDNGKIELQKIIPRKILFFRNRTRFKNIAELMIHAEGDSLKLVLLEHPNNFKYSAEPYVYRSFKKSGLWNSNVVCYVLKANGRLEKKLIYKNDEFDLIPLRYSSNGQKDMIFYLNNSKFEKFAILKLYPF